MEKYPKLNQAVGEVLRSRREELGLSKRKLSELAMIERAYITGLEAGKWNASLNVIFYLCEGLQITPLDFMKQVIEKLSEPISNSTTNKYIY